MPSAFTIHNEADERPGRRRVRRFRLPVRAHRPWLREIFILFVFCALTAVMTWPWVTRMRDAVADPGDPYTIAWTLWWDYHQTFHDPINLFHANVFYPYQYTLAFSEHDYGIALLCFPLFALGLKALTVNSVATFMGFAFSGYGAFRLARTLTGSNGAAWVAGVVFAFIPYRFHLLSHLHYLFAGWIPLLAESLVLFARERTWRRASWLGVAFLMNALTCITWFILTLIPLGLTATLLILRYRIARDRALWRRGAVALGASSLVLLPFMLPYYYVAKMYGFVRSVEETANNSPTLWHWLAAERRTRLWEHFGDNITGGGHKLFPGLLPLLLALVTLLFGDAGTRRRAGGERETGRMTGALDALALAALAVAIIATGYVASQFTLFGVRFFEVVTASRALFIVLVALGVRLSIAYPERLRRIEARNLLDSLRSTHRSEAFDIGLIWVVTGFCGSLGMNFFLNRILYDFVPIFRGMRIPSRWAMIAYLGLALMAGVGASHIAERVARWHRRRVPATAVFALFVAALLFELHACPLEFYRGAVFPDALTLRLKETPMRGGLVELPHDPDALLPHRYILRAADHERPLVNGTSSFISPLTWEIQSATQSGPIAPHFLDLLESIPASYLIVHSTELPPTRRADYEAFLVLAMKTGRLRFIHRYGTGDDLYAVTKTEPDARSEEPPPFAELHEWGASLSQDSLSLLGNQERWSELIYRLHIAADGSPPRFTNFLPDVQAIGRGVVLGIAGQESQLNDNVRRYTEELVICPAFRSAFGNTGGEEYVSKLLANTGITISAAERTALVNGLNDATETRASVLLKIAGHEQFARREHSRALVRLHYFAYLQRNPGDPPDKDMDGFNFWVRDFEESGRVDRLSAAFTDSIEYKARMSPSPHPAVEENKSAPR